MCRLLLYQIYTQKSIKTKITPHTSNFSPYFHSFLSFQAIAGIQTLLFVCEENLDSRFHGNDTGVRGYKPK